MQIGVTNFIGGVTGGATIPLAAAPVANVTLLGQAVVGTLVVDQSTGIVYSCTATNMTSTVAWTKVGTQT